MFDTYQEVNYSASTKAVDVTAPQGVYGYFCTLAILQKFLTLKEIILIHIGMSFLLLPTNRQDKDSVWNKQAFK